MTNHQRIGSISNAHAGQDFEVIAKAFLEKELNISLISPFFVELGVDRNRLAKHKFDLGSKEGKVLIECKSYSWTKGFNIPSAKLSNWDKEMYYFQMLSQSEQYKNYRMIFFVQRFTRIYKNNDQSLSEFYFEKRSHMIPNRVEIWEYDVDLEIVQIKSI